MKISTFKNVSYTDLLHGIPQIEFIRVYFIRKETWNNKLTIRTVSKPIEN